VKSEQTARKSQCFKESESVPTISDKIGRCRQLLEHYKKSKSALLSAQQRLPKTPSQLREISSKQKVWGLPVTGEPCPEDTLGAEQCELITLKGFMADFKETDRIHAGTWENLCLACDEIANHFHNRSAAEVLRNIRQCPEDETFRNLPQQMLIFPRDTQNIESQIIGALGEFEFATKTVPLTRTELVEELWRIANNLEVTGGYQVKRFGEHGEEIETEKRIAVQEVGRLLQLAAAGGLLDAQAMKIVARYPGDSVSWHAYLGNLQRHFCGAANIPLANLVKTVEAIRAIGKEILAKAKSVNGSADVEQAAGLVANKVEVPLTDKEHCLVQILATCKPREGRTGKQIKAKAIELGETIEQSELTKRLIPTLRAKGIHVENVRGAGYYLADTNQREQFSAKFDIK